MVVSPTHWVKKVMQLTKISWGFKLTVLGLGLAYLFAAKVADVWVLPAAARLVGRTRLALTGRPKKRKEYKVILERMRT